MRSKRIRERLNLCDVEVALIKAFLQKGDMNDQMVQSMFSHLGRTINHREIGYVRSGHLKYGNVEAAAEQVVEEFLLRYKRSQIHLKKAGILPSESHFQLVCKSREAMLAAIAVHNNPNIDFKSEIFITNAIISWTYLLHARLKTLRITYIYQDLTKHGQAKHYELGKCLDLPECDLDKHTKNNLKYILEVRHEIEHRMTENVDATLSAKMQACALNFNDWIARWLGSEYRIDYMLPFSIQLSQISINQLDQLKGTRGLPAIIQTVNRSFEDALDDEEIAHPRYAYRVYLVPRTANRQGSADQAAEFLHPESEKGKAAQFAIKEVEKSKLTSTEVVNRMQALGFINFRMHELTRFGKKIDAKNPKRALGVHLAGRWFWYEPFLKMVEEHCKEQTTA